MEPLKELKILGGGEKPGQIRTTEPAREAGRASAPSGDAVRESRSAAQTQW